MKTRKTLLLLGTALAAVLLAVPAAAQGAGRLYDVKTGKTVSSGTEIHLTGTETFTTVEAGFECKKHVIVTAHVIANGTVHGSVTTEECEGSGMLAGCEIKSVKATNAPWKFSVNTEDLVVTDVTNDVEFDSECALSAATVETPEMTVTAKEPTKGISTVLISGEGTADLGEVELPLEVSGHLEVTGGAAGTYGIEHVAPNPFGKLPRIFSLGPA